MKTQVIIPAAGEGMRLKTSVPKPLVLLKGKPLFIHCLEIFEQSALIDSVIVVGGKYILEDLEKIIRKYNLKKVRHVIEGGLTRAASVFNGLQVLDQDTDTVAVHDAARPLISLAVVEQAIKLCATESAVTVAVPVKPTIKKVNSKTLYVESTLDRETLWEIQTPQVFKKDLLIKAHQTVKDEKATDDAYLVEKAGHKVKIVQGEYRNIKITTPEDLKIAEALME